MPIYTYRCDSCDRSFEYRQRMSDDPIEQCILCNKTGVRRVINSVGIVFKGNGFYVTDNRGKNGALASARSGGESGEKSGEGSEKSEAKSSVDTVAPAATEKKDKVPAAE